MRAEYKMTQEVTRTAQEKHMIAARTKQREEEKRTVIRTEEKKKRRKQRQKSEKIVLKALFLHKIIRNTLFIYC